MEVYGSFIEFGRNMIEFLLSFIDFGSNFIEFGWNWKELEKEYFHMFIMIF